MAGCSTKRSLFISKRKTPNQLVNSCPPIYTVSINEKIIIIFSLHMYNTTIFSQIWSHFFLYKNNYTKLHSHFSSWGASNVKHWNLVVSKMRLRRYWILIFKTLAYFFFSFIDWVAVFCCIKYPFYDFTFYTKAIQTILLFFYFSVIRIGL